MPRTAIGCVGLTAFEAQALRALVDLDAFTPGASFHVGTIKRRGAISAEHWRWWMYLTRDGHATKTGESFLFDPLRDRFAITPSGREALAALGLPYIAPEHRSEWSLGAELQRARGAA